MRSNEIVIREVKRNGGLEVFNLLAECVSKPRQSAHVQASDSVQPFDVARRNQIHIRMTSNRPLLDKRDRWRAIAALLMMLALVNAVILDNDSIVNIHSESILDGFR